MKLTCKKLEDLIAEELKTSKEYISTGKKDHIPALVKAGKQEKKHADLFKRLKKHCKR